MSDNINTADLIEQVVDGVVKTVPGMVTDAIDSNDSIKWIKAEIKTLKANNVVEKFIDWKRQKETIVKIAREVIKGAINSESAFTDLVTKTLWANDTTYTNSGAELVFDQFSNDILMVMQDYSLIKELSILTLAKGDNILLPKATNWITTAYVGEAGTPGTSEYSTAQIKIDVYKAMTLTNMTEELLSDALTTEDAYKITVRAIWESQAAFLENEILNGTGDNAIEWLYTWVTTNVIALPKTKTVSDIGDDEIIDVITRAGTEFKKRSENLVFILSQYTYWKLLRLKTLDWYPLYPELRNFQSPTLMGYRVIKSSKNPVQNVTEDVADANVLLFGDIKSYYQAVKRAWVTLETWYYGNNWRDWIKSVKSQMRMWGRITFEEAFVVLRNWAAA